MNMIRKAILALALSAGLAPAFAQVAPPVPALPDTERRTSYSISASTCACNVGFALYGDSTDYANWIEVFVNGVRMTQAGNWTLSSVTGTIGSIPLPITNAVLTFTAPQTGTIQIVGARRPRRTSQFNEGAGVPTRNFNVVLSDLTAQNRELWDKTNDVTGRALLSQPGNTLSMLPLPSACAGKFLGFDATGLIPQCNSGGAGSGNVVGPLSSTVGHFATWNNLTGTLLADHVIGLPDLPFDSGTWRTVATADPIVNTDCGKTVALGGNVSFTETLPVVAGFPAGCKVTIKNTDTYPGGAGKILSGFPADLDTILYPLQIAQVKIVNGAWVTILNPGRWKNPTTVTWHVDKTNGNNANDGLATGAGRAIQDAQTANTRAVYKSDTQGTTPIIAMACGQTHTTAMNMGGTPTGTNLIQLSPDGNCGFTWTNAGPCISIADLAELDLNLTFYGGSGTATFGCNQSNALANGNIYLHNAVVLDLEGTPIWNPAGANDNFIFCDGPCEFTIANGITQATGAGGNYVINMSQGGKGTQSGTISASASGGAQGIYYLYGPALLSIGTASGGGWSSLGTSKINGGATLVNNGITPAGGVAVGVGSANCTSLTSATCTIGTVPVANGGTGDTGTAWTTFTPSATCGTATFTTNSAKSKTLGKTTFLQIDITISVLGTCANTVIFTLPNTAASSGGMAGREIAFNGHGINCNFSAASTSVSCAFADTAAMVATERFNISGVYENQ